MSRAPARLPSVFTPSTLAERWACSERKVRLMIDNGAIPAFRLDGKLLRIRIADVEAFECQNGGSQDSVENSASHGRRGQSADVIDWAQQTPRKRPSAPRLDMPSSHAREVRQFPNSGKGTPAT